MPSRITPERRPPRSVEPCVGVKYSQPILTRKSRAGIRDSRSSSNDGVNKALLAIIQIPQVEVVLSKAQLKDLPSGTPFFQGVFALEISEHHLSQIGLQFWPVPRGRAP